MGTALVEAGFSERSKKEQVVNLLSQNTVFGQAQRAYVLDGRWQIPLKVHVTLPSCQG
jgi:hypothetical protein